MYINGQFPGPMIEANWGDWIQVTVRNNITGPEDGTSVHWHGMLQKETPWMDGVPSISQCPIAPGSSFEYRFRADIYGTSWYHSHYSAQYLDGAFGPLIIYGPTDVKFDVDLGPVMLQDCMSFYPNLLPFLTRCRLPSGILPYFAR
jgi:FtsP/CotA-like multicopper oxidase with cupredoxin domain